MDERWARLRGLVEGALDLPLGDREAFLDSRCEGDAALREEAADWLASAEDDEPFLEPPLRPAGRRALTVGDQIGPFRLTRKIASGGMGTVYEAEQQEPRRRVALKVMRAGPWTPASERRFRYEVEVLAGLRHPGIAQIHQTGIHDGDVPWFAMEFVDEAETIVAHARRRHLSLADRVRLFASVCDAVGHGHLNGVIHRDLKPDNLLVGGDGRPKVIDFGVARATGGGVPGATLTRTGEIVGTLDYMSPEQVGGTGASVDTRSDVYALGVVLYQLLCAELPHGSEPRDLISTARLIAETPPRRPSRLVREVRGDVETILLKCLEKDPARRYASAGELAADLRRWLAREPVAARPPSVTYTLSMLARRHRGAALGLAAAVVALVAGTVVSVWFGLDAERQRTAADEGRRAAEFGGYVANIAAADASLGAGQIGEARARLTFASEAHRGWEWRHLLRRSSPSRLTFVWKDHHAVAAAWHPDLPLLACVALSNTGETTVRVFEHDRLLREIGPSPGPSRAVAFCPGEARIAIGRSSGEIEIHVLHDDAEVQILEAHAAAVTALAFDSDGKRLISGAVDGTVRTWDWPSATEAGQRKLPGAIVWVTDACAVSAEGTVRVGERKFHLGSQVARAAATPDGRYLAAAAKDGEVGLWDLGTGEPAGTLSGHTGPVRAVAFSADGNRVATTQDAAIRLWDISSRRCEATLLGHTTTILGAAFAPDGRRLASVSADGETKVWRARPQDTVPTLPTRDAWTIALDPGGTRLASGDMDGTLRLWDVAERREVAAVAGGGGIHALRFGPHGKRIAVGRETGVLQVIDVTTLGENLRLDTGHGSVWAALFLDSGAQLVTAGDDGTLRTWDASRGTKLAEWPGHTGRVRALAASPDGAQLASGSVDKSVRLWDAATGETLAVLAAHEHKVVSVAFGPAGRRLASGGFDLKVRVWDLATRRAVHAFPGSHAVGFSADGRRLFGLRARVVWNRETATGEPVMRLRGHRQIVIAAAVSADGSTLASLDRDIASNRRSTKVWETRGGSRVVETE